MSQLHICNGHVIDPANSINKVCDIFIDTSTITAIGKAPKGFQADTRIDAKNCYVIPGLVELSARCREPGYEHKGSIYSETRAAAHSGITTLCIPPDTLPVIDSPAVMELIHQRAEKAGFAKLVLLGALTANLQNEQLSEIAALKHAGCVGISNANSNISNTLIQRRAMEYVATHNLTLFIKAQDIWLTNHGCAHEGEISLRLGLSGIPDTAETVAIARDILLIEQTGVRAHFCQLSTLQAVKLITAAQARGLPITADVSAHQLHLSDRDIAYFDANCHVLPPLRSQRDQLGLRQALRDNIVSAICADHQPHDRDAKLAPFSDTEPGMSTLETLLPLSLRLVEQGVLTLPQVINLLTCQPANILGINAGTLGIGENADICIFDTHSNWMFDSKNMISHGKNSPFNGWDMHGKVHYTLLDGKIVYQSGSK